MKNIITAFLYGYVTLVTSIAQASVVLDGTRLIYPENSREVTLQMYNPEQTPLLVQAWVDRGDPDSTADKADAPFFLQPPIVRIDSNKGQALKLMFTHQETLPKDRESVFWLNVMDIPPIPPDASNFVQVSYRSRIKLIYRPSKLPGNLIKAAGSISWTLIDNGDGHFVLRGKNASAFYVSFNQVSLSDGQHSYGNDGGMVAPYSTEDFLMEQLKELPSKQPYVNYTWIDDFGATHKQKTRLTPN